MSKQKLKVNKIEKPTWIGRFAHWADSVQVNGKIVKLSLLIWSAAFVSGQQDSNWEILRGEKVVRAQSALPQFALKKDNAHSEMGCRSEEKLAEKIVGEYSLTQYAIKKNIEKIIAEKPMQKMIASVAERDPQTASYLVAIAKKESNLGKFSPKDENGQECFNYWGYRGRENTTKSGYSCFDSPEQAVQVVGDRIQYLSQIKDFDTPEKMRVWKCGYDCSWDNKAAVKKWIADVDLYYKKINNDLAKS